MSLAELFTELASHNIELSVINGSIRCHPGSALTPPLISALRDQKPQVIGLIHRIDGGKPLAAAKCLKSIQDKTFWIDALHEAVQRIASLCQGDTYAKLTIEQREKLAKSGEALDQTLVLQSDNPLSAIEAWEREWILALGHHPVPQEDVFRIQRWDDGEILTALQKGIAVKIWSVVLGEWIYWVRDDGVAEQTAAKHPGIPIYTLQELKIITQAAWSREYLTQTHLAKHELGAKLLSSSRIEHRRD